SRTSSPRRGAGTLRQLVNAAAAAAMASSAPAGVASWTWAIAVPVIGERTSRPPPVKAARSRPRRSRRAWVSAWTSCMRAGVPRVSGDASAQVEHHHQALVAGREREALARGGAAQRGDELHGAGRHVDQAELAV